MNKRFVWTILTAVILFGTAPAVRAALLVSDSFTVGHGTGTAGSDLNGTAAEVGGVNWVANSTVDFHSGNYIQRNDLENLTNNVAVVPFAPGAGDSMLSVSARVRVTDSASTVNFVGFGFTQTATTTPFWTPGGGEVWMFLSVEGKYDVFAKDTAFDLTGSHAAPGYAANGFNTLELRLNRTTNELSALVNGTFVLTNYDLDGRNFTPSIGGAGFFLFANTSSADDFLVAAPEPTAIGGVFAVGAAAALRRRRAGRSY
jgi:hypothetical protein